MKLMKCAFAMVGAILVSGQPGMAATKKPLKIFILSGQSNMQGHAMVETFEGVGDDPETKAMYEAMTGSDGKPTVSGDVYINYLTEVGGRESPTPKVVSGPLAAGYGAPGRGVKIGPEFTFGLYMHEYLDEPILIIKTAWGGKSLHTDFRPPSAGPYVWTDESKVDEKKKREKIGRDRCLLPEDDSACGKSSRESR